MRRPTVKKTKRNSPHPLQVEYMEKMRGESTESIQKPDFLTYVRGYLKENFSQYKSKGKFDLYKKVKENTDFKGNIFEFDVQICKYMDQKELSALLLETNGTKEFFKKPEVLMAIKDWQKSSQKMKEIYDKLKEIEKRQNSEFKLDYIQLRIGLHYNNINWIKLI